MSKKSPSENLKSFSIIYIILIVLYIIGALLFYVILFQRLLIYLKGVQKLKMYY